MKIQLLRDWFNPDTGKIVEKNKLIDVTRWRGRWLIKKRIGREENEEVPVVVESTKDKLLEKEAEETPPEKTKRTRKSKQEEN